MLSASTWRPSSSRSSRISSRTMPRSMSMSRNAGCESTSPKSAQASSSDSGGRVARRCRGRPASRRRASPPSCSNARFTSCALGIAARAPVDHVLEEVADAVVFARLEPRPDARPEGDVRAVKLRLRRDDDREAVGEGAVRSRGSYGSSLVLFARPRRPARRRPSPPGCRLVDLDVVLRLSRRRLTYRESASSRFAANDSCTNASRSFVELVARCHLVLLQLHDDVGVRAYGTGSASTSPSLRREREADARWSFRPATARGTGRRRG